MKNKFYGDNTITNYRTFTVNGYYNKYVSKKIVDKNLTYHEALERCKQFNDNRDAQQIWLETKICFLIYMISIQKTHKVRSAIMTSLRELPICPTLTENKISDSYIKELKDANDVKSLREFLERWNVVFRLNYPGRLDTESLVKLADKTYTDEELEEAIICMKELKVGLCKHCDTVDDGCIGTNIILPPLFLYATLVSSKYGVSIDLAIIQMNGGVSELEYYGDVEYGEFFDNG